MSGVLPEYHDFREVLSKAKETLTTAGLQYLVIWEGYGPKERFWLPVCHIFKPRPIAKLHQQHLHHGHSGNTPSAHPAEEEEDMQIC